MFPSRKHWPSHHSRYGIFSSEQWDQRGLIGEKLTPHENVLNKQSDVTNGERSLQQKGSGVCVFGRVLVNVSHRAVLTELIHYVCNDLLMKRGALASDEASSSPCRWRLCDTTKSRACVLGCALLIHCGFAGRPTSVAVGSLKGWRYSSCSCSHNNRLRG